MKTLTDFLEEQNLNMSVRLLPDGKTFKAEINGSDIAEDGMLRSAYGRGDTSQRAVADMVEVIRGRNIAIYAGGFSRRDIGVPLDLAAPVPRPQKGSGDFSIGSKLWPGTAKLQEEMGELNQVLGKLIASHGETKHWSGDLKEKLIEEISDVAAAIQFFIEMNMRDCVGPIGERHEMKTALFHQWQKDPVKP